MSDHSAATVGPAGRPFDWDRCVAAFDDVLQRRLANWRGLGLAFVTWLRARGLIGIWDSGRIAFPVHDPAGVVVGCHYRRKEDGRWRYYPAGIRVLPLVLGDLRNAMIAWVFESQWDALALMNLAEWHLEPPPDTAVLITRGAGNARSIAGRCRPDATVYAFTQNDPAGQQWLSGVAANCGCPCRAVLTPTLFKDVNDWTRAGATWTQLEAAISAASPPALVPAPDRDGAASGASSSLDAQPTRDEVEEDPQDPFPTDALPPDIAVMVRAVARQLRVPESLVAIVALGILSASIGSGLVVQSDAQRTTMANVFLIASATSGSGKSEVFRVVAEPFLRYQEQIQQTFRATSLPRLQAELRVIETQLKRLDRETAKANDPEQLDRLRGELEFKLALREAITQQLQPSLLLAQDTTVERLAVLLQQNGEQMFSSSADARKLIDNLLGRYSANKMTDESLYLCGFSGDHVRVDRQNREPVVLQRPCLALLWLVQPDALELLFGEESLTQGGFLPRCLMGHTRAEPQKIEGDSVPLPEAIRKKWNSLIEELVKAYRRPMQPGADGSPSNPASPADSSNAPCKTQVVKPTDDARDRLVAYFNETVDERQDEKRDISSFVARWGEQAWRVGLCVHAGLHRAHAHEQSLGAETADNAILITGWFARQQVELLSRSRHQAARKLEDEVLGLLTDNCSRKNMDHITVREVQRARIVPTAEAARKLLTRMEADHVLVGEDVMPQGGGTQTRIYRAAVKPGLLG